MQLDLLASQHVRPMNSIKLILIKYDTNMYYSTGIYSVKSSVLYTLPMSHYRGMETVTIPWMKNGIKMN